MFTLIMIVTFEYNNITGGSGCQVPKVCNEYAHNIVVSLKLVARSQYEYVRDAVD